MSIWIGRHIQSNPLLKWSKCSIYKRFVVRAILLREQNERQGKRQAFPFNRNLFECNLFSTLYFSSNMILSNYTFSKYQFSPFKSCMTFPLYKTSCMNFKINYGCFPPSQDTPGSFSRVMRVWEESLWSIIYIYI